VKKLIRLRKEKPALHRGKWIRTLKGHRGVIGYYRVHEEQEIFVALNFTPREKYIHSHNRGQWKVILSTHHAVNSHLTDIRITLKPYEATIVEKIGTL
jgi:glycosidase